MAGRFTELLKNTGRAVDLVLRETEYVCRSMGPRAPGSEGEKKAAAYMAGFLKDRCGCGSVKTERFREHPASFYGYFHISAVIGLLTIASFFLRPWLSLLFGVTGLTVFVLHFVLYKKVLDPLFPERESVNVTAVRPCAGEVRRRLFLCGHVDAAWEFPLNYRFGGIVFEIPGVVSVAGELFYIAVSIAALLGAGEWTRQAALWGIATAPFFVLMGCTYDHRRVVDGANDDLSGCFLGMALLREMERQGVRPEHTEFGVILTGSEEAGTRGAKAWAAAHRGEYRDVPTYILCLDTIHDPRHLMVNERDLNGTVRTDGELSAMFLDAARKAGVPCRAGGVPPFGGSTDSAAFTQGGFRSVCVTGLSHVLERYYHTRMDSYDNMNREGLENCYRALVTLVGDLDAKE